MIFYCFGKEYLEIFDVNSLEERLTLDKNIGKIIASVLSKRYKLLMLFARNQKNLLEKALPKSTIQAKRQ